MIEGTQKLIKNESISDISQKIFHEAEKIEIKQENRNSKGELLVYPTGPVSKLSERNWKIVRTEAFKEWFDESNVVDENNEPILVFHGSGKKEFEGVNLRPELSGQIIGPWVPKFGTFFSSDMKVIKAFLKNTEDPVVFSSFLKIKHPLYIKRHLDLEELAESETQESLLEKNVDGIIQKEGNLSYMDSDGNDLYGNQYVIFKSDQAIMLPSEIK